MRNVTKSRAVTKSLGGLMIAALACGMPAADVLAGPGDATAEQAIAALEGTFGVHPGQRRNHIKGTCALGHFVGRPELATYSRSALFSGAAIPVVARFSLGGGDPNASDADHGVRGMALELRLPGGGLQHFTMIDSPMFFAAVPRTFVDLLLAAKPDPATGKPDPEKLKAFVAGHPEARAQLAFQASHNPPVSYANDAYHGVHTFKFIDARDRNTLVRWRFVPEDGERWLSDDEMKSAPRNFLEQALIDRTGQGPVRWNMVVTIGEPGDPQLDPTVLWPAERKELAAGTLTISSAMAQKGAECENINFDPLVMSDGIAPTDDPVLLFRSPSYALSFAKRLGGL